MKKIINPCKSAVIGKGFSDAFCKIKYVNGELSITGVIGPMSNGNCRGAAGQCIDEIRKGKPIKNWTEEMLLQFCDVWESYHLNHMRPYCKHQKELGWDKLALVKVTLFQYQLTEETRKEINLAKMVAINAIKMGQTFTPTVEQTMLVNLSFTLTSHTDLPREIAGYYEPRGSLFGGDYNKASETKILGLLYPKEHPHGILTKPCPICGYKYGSGWEMEEIPKEIIDWLFSLPEADVNPAWI